MSDYNRIIAYDSKTDVYNLKTCDSPDFKIFDVSDGSLVQTYDLFNLEGRKSNSMEYVVSDYLNNWQVMNSSRQKIAIAMYYFPQINILDVNTGECKGFRLKGRKKFDSENRFAHFLNMAADDQYIYCLYAGFPRDHNPIDSDCTLIVFDWQGNIIKECLVGKYCHIYSSGEKLLLADPLCTRLDYLNKADIL